MRQAQQLRMFQVAKSVSDIAAHGRKAKRTTGWGEKRPLRTLTVLIPVFYNPTSTGVQMPVERSKHKQTEAEIRRRFSGYSVSSINGWYRSAKDGTEFRDRNLRFEIDVVVTSSLKQFLSAWKKVLERRFRQEAIYMKLSAPSTWI
jgi:hypothetical protein